MSKKYLSIEEAAAQIGISTAEVNRLREKGTLRAFADRGTWKFKEEDVEKLVRTRQPDSDPDVPLRASEGDSVAELVFSDDDALGSQPTILRRGTDDTGSDSDVRLIFDDSMSVPQSKEGVAPEEDSDSDVKLAGGTDAAADGGSDSDVKLVTDDEPTQASGSDSDVRLVSSDSSGEVQLAGADEVKKGGSTINLDAAGEGSSVIEAGDSGISLAEGSGIALASDSGISLERPNDSGISLSEESVTQESGISLAQDDSGISLSSDAPIAKGKGKKAKAPADSDDLTGTIPLMDVPAAESEDILDTNLEVPMVGDSSDEIKASGGTPTSVITLDEDEEYAVGDKGEAEEDVFAGDEAVVDVEDEIVGEDDELGEDVFGAEDEDFGEVESGVSSADMPVGARLAAPIQQDWGPGVFAGLALSAVLMIACGTIMFDLVRNMWFADVANQNPISSMLLDTFKG
jgi:excisionase family DNA binding protein